MMAEDPDGTPDEVTLLIINDGEPVWASNLTQTQAERFANNTIQGNDFALSLTETARGPWADKHPLDLEPKLVWMQGNNSRLSYAVDIVERLEYNEWSEYYNVTDYGLYNETIYLPGTIESYDPYESVYVEIKVPRVGEEIVTYRNENWTASSAGIAMFEAIYATGNATYRGDVGEVPKAVHLRLVDENETLHTTTNIPQAWADDPITKGVDVGTIYQTIILNEQLTTNYDEDGNPI
jgi:hypothetical protein